jgi:hypothetical protein
MSMSFDRMPEGSPGQEMAAGTEELFTPTLQQYYNPSASMKKRAWRLRSQFWVAFFGGVLPCVVISLINGRRLNLPARQLRWMIVLGIIGIAAIIATGYGFAFMNMPPLWAENRSGFKLANRAIALLVYILCYQFQKQADRIYSFYNGESYDSLWTPGLIAVIGLGLLQNALVYVAIFLFTGTMFKL